MHTIESHKGGPDEAAKAGLTRLTTQWKEDEVHQSPKDVVSHDSEGLYQPGDMCDNPKYSKNLDQQWHDSHGQ
jgi:hypothetical protein